MIKRLLPGSFRVNYRLRMEEGVVQAVPMLSGDTVGMTR
jgi:hypothetical protein